MCWPASILRAFARAELFFPPPLSVASFIRAQAREEMRKPIHGLAASNRIALLRTVRVQADGRHKCRLKVLFQKRRGVRDFVSSRMCFAPERVDGPEVEIAALGEVVVHGIDDRLSLSIKSTRKSCKTSPRS